MAKKIGIFDRISQLVKANINDLLDKAEDPQKMLAQLILDYTNNIREAEGSVAQLIGTLRLLEKDYAEDAKTVKEWGEWLLWVSCVFRLLLIYRWYRKACYVGVLVPPIYYTL